MREPIFWTNTKDGYNKPDRERTRWANGKKYTERVPQGPHDGSSSYENPTRLPNNRARLVLNTSGNEIWHVITNAAAHIDTSCGYAQQQIMKERYFGWLRVGTCPILSMMSGEIDPDKIMERSFFEPNSNSITVKPCPPGVHGATNPCPHYLQERATRLKAQKELMDSKQAGYANEADKLLQTVGMLVEAQQRALLTQSSVAAPLVETPVQTEIPVADPKRKDKDR